ncbi:MAG: molecular chaperone HscC [Rheinheimera sp.]|uniref:molecular chaperone HscC n=1 Tax=Arsukibacterium sp. UBA3155 TaxID=1946058 RepID=UPI000C893C5E|nr:molecular chaperone HscC [Arsukibacterium sp. UBA3155]MAD74709.1 molecular chaperone HscC [Rheinheimera sp.]|tara:strand:- start:149729 stop:151414 length:1686 start_codon:yes stop_codon:yes gene_type:complete
MAIIGIDLGTTNSTCCAWKDNELLNIPNALNSLLTPSVVGLDDDKNILVGQIAKERLLTHPDKTVAVFKRLMGSEHKVKIASHSFSAPELSSLVIRSLIKDAEAHLGEKVTEAVISVPAYFNENQRAATKLAGELAGIKVRRLINEPTAAAIAYGLNKRQEGTFLILDMGGGTFDVSIMEYFSGIMEVHASSGDNFLGGEDFVQAMIDHVLSAKNVSIESLSTTDSHLLYLQMESLKKRIDEVDEEILSFQLNGETVEFKVDQQWFQRVITPLLLRVRNPIQLALQDAGMHAQQIDEVILVGGATRLKHFRVTVAKLLGRILSCDIDPDIVVGMGAGIQAGLLVHNQALEDVVLTDVCPYTLGTEVVDENGNPGLFMPIIERNSVVPISIERTVHTVRDNQDALMIKIFQGENRRVEKNVFLGFVNVPLPKSKAGTQSARIRYSYDMNGLLVVDVSVDSTGKTFNKVIENAPGMLSESEKQKSLSNLDKLKFHPRDNQKNAQLIAKADRLFKSNLGQVREQLASAIANFERILEAQNKISIEKAQQEFSNYLDVLEKEGRF